MPYLPCFLCGRKLDKRISKKNKPYFCCDYCGVQLFVRRKQGIERLEEVFKNIAKAQIPYQEHSHNFHEMQGILQEINDLETELKKMGSWWLTDTQAKIRKSVETRKNNLLFQLKQFAEKK